MVAPREVGEPVRSFVRVPTEDRVAKALCWDLSRASTLVATTAPVRPLIQAQAQAHAQAQAQAQPQAIPIELQNRANSSLKPSQELLQAQTQPVEFQAQVQSAEPQPRPQPQAQPVEVQKQTSSQQSPPSTLPPHQAPPTPCEQKRPREEEKGEDTSQPVVKVARVAGCTGPGSSSSTPAPPCQDTEVERLRQQCQTLRQQNEALQQRLGLFHTLFRDKERLKTFVSQRVK